MRKDVLLFGSARDPHVRALATEVRRRGATARLLNPRAYPVRSHLSLSIAPGRAPRADTDDVDLERCGVGWIGTSRTVTLAGGLMPQARRFAKAAALQGIDSFLRACPFPWINDPDAAHRADDKFHQLVVAQQLGFTIPTTLVSNDPARFLRLQRRQPALIAKSMTGSAGLPASKRVLTNRVGPDDVRHAESVQEAPVLFQDYVEKSTELRVTVVGSHVYPVRIHSQESERTRVDWRRYGPGLRYAQTTLPVALRDRCVKLTRRLGLSYGGIDVVHRPDGEYVFLEINSLPAWLWLEEATGVPLTAAIVDFLESRMGRRRAAS